MLSSMTGYGEARYQDPGRTVYAEVRSVNNRHLKFSARISDAIAALEPEVERLVRDRVRRGTVQLVLRVDRPHTPEDYRINLIALASYRDQLLRLVPDPSRLDPGALLSLPGVVEDSSAQPCDPHEEWPLVRKVLLEALDNFEKSRAEEGRAMCDELASLAQQISAHLDRVATRTPDVVKAYQARLVDRVQNVLRDHGVALEPRDLIREVAIFADRSDVSEEIVRLRAHLVQFHEILDQSPSAGRKLEFLVQEIGREANTLGSKSNDVQVSREVVEIKGLIEKIRELIQNVE